MTNKDKEEVEILSKGCKDCKVKLFVNSDQMIDASIQFCLTHGAAEIMLKACEAVVQDFEDEDSKMKIDPASCIHLPNHTDLCPYWLSKQAIIAIREKI